MIGLHTIGLRHVSRVWKLEEGGPDCQGGVPRLSVLPRLLAKSGPYERLSNLAIAGVCMARSSPDPVWVLALVPNWAWRRRKVGIGSLLDWIVRLETNRDV